VNSFGRQCGIGGPAPTKRLPHLNEKEDIMKTIAKVIESMLTKDATQQWTGQTSAVDTWGWGNAVPARETWGWGN
jgi:hypothetical protein